MSFYNDITRTINNTLNQYEREIVNVTKSIVTNKEPDNILKEDNKNKEGELEI